MKTLREKLKKQGGFTMVEMLIVVAIIAILMAVSIPMFNNALEKARHGVDSANLRSAISMANAEAIASLDPKTEFADPQEYYYVVDDNGDHQGVLVNIKDGNKDDAVYPECTTAKQAPLKVRITYNASAGPLDVFKIETSWQIDTTGHVVAKEGTYYSETTKTTTTP